MEWKNTNKLLDRGFDGAKTGTTDSAGPCLASSYSKTLTINKNLIKTIDILGRETTNKGFQLHIYDDGSVEKKYLIK